MYCFSCLFAEQPEQCVEYVSKNNEQVQCKRLGNYYCQQTGKYYCHLHLPVDIKFKEVKHKRYSSFMIG